MKNWFIVFGVCALMLSCSSDDSLTQEEIDTQNRADIEAYISKNGLVTMTTSTGVYYTIEEPGDTEKPALSDRVTVHYEGYLLDGSVFDSSIARGMPSTFSLTNVIAGWQIGIPLYGKGGKGTLLIPSRLAYGGRSPSNAIPANAVLVFDIEVIDF